MNNILTWLIPLVITVILAFGEIYIVKVRVDYLAARYEKIILKIQKIEDRGEILYEYCCSELDKKGEND